MSIAASAGESGPQGEKAETIDGFAISDGGQSTPALPKARPVDASERVASVDVLRGVALLGILAMNIVGFAWPWEVYEIPILDPGARGIDTALWAFNHVIFDTKMMTLFSMLFGAGLVLMSDRADGRGARVRGVYYRRLAWLLLIGLIHSYLIWDGDILVLYACCGFFLYPLRRLSPRSLIILGLCLNSVLLPVIFGGRATIVPYMERASARVDAATKKGRPSSWWDQAVHDTWKEIEKADIVSREDFIKEIAIHRSSYPEIVRHRAGPLVKAQTFGFLLGGFWFSGGRMLIGMGLMKLGVFSGRLSRRSYLWMMLIGYGIGLPLLVFDSLHEVRNHFFLGHRLAYALEGWPLLALYGGLPVVFGHIGAVMLLYRSGALTWLTRRLAAAGRMALSNYLFDSIVCTTLFYGYGFDLYGAIQRPLLYAIVVIIWALQLLISPLWLEHFRFGPAEWVWRSLTYAKLQPMRSHPGSIRAAVA